MRLLVAIPAFNEELTIGRVIQDVQRAVAAEIVVVDDASSDATAAVAAECGVHVLKMPFNVGVGGAMRTAFTFALRHGFDVVVQVDGDGQHDPTEIPLLLSAVGSGASVVVGSRFANGYETTRGRRFAMRLLAGGVGVLTGQTLTDTTSGFRAADRRAIEFFAQRYPAEYLGDTTESLVVAARAGLSVKEVEVHMRERQGGRASHRSARSALYLGRVVMALAVAAMTRRESATE